VYRFYQCAFPLCLTAAVLAPGEKFDFSAFAEGNLASEVQNELAPAATPAPVPLPVTVTEATPETPAKGKEPAPANAASLPALPPASPLDSPLPVTETDSEMLRELDKEEKEAKEREEKEAKEREEKETKEREEKEKEAKEKEEKEDEEETAKQAAAGVPQLPPSTPPVNRFRIGRRSSSTPHPYVESSTPSISPLAMPPSSDHGDTPALSPSALPPSASPSPSKTTTRPTSRELVIASALSALNSELSTSSSASSPTQTSAMAVRYARDCASACICVVTDLLSLPPAIHNVSCLYLLMFSARKIQCYKNPDC
jgi:hypothetical protein